MADTVTLEYTAASPLADGRRTVEDVEVLERMGDIVKMANPWDDDEHVLVLDSEGDLWARVRNRPSTDGLFGWNAEVTPSEPVLEEVPFPDTDSGGSR